MTSCGNQPADNTKPPAEVVTKVQTVTEPIDPSIFAGCPDEDPEPAATADPKLQYQWLYQAVTEGRACRAVVHQVKNIVAAQDH